MTDTQACEHCRPIVEAMKADVVKIIDDMLSSDCELVRHYAQRHGLVEGAGREPVSHPRDVAAAVLHILQEPGAGVSDAAIERLRIRSALLQTSIRGDAT